ncbi:MAG: hypothetical protein WCK49_05045 [Myxococcaceae bacterium]
MAQVREIVQDQIETYVLAQTDIRALLMRLAANNPTAVIPRERRFIEAGIEAALLNLRANRPNMPVVIDGANMGTVPRIPAEYLAWAFTRLGLLTDAGFLASVDK